MGDIQPPSTPERRPPSRTGAVKGQETPRSDPPTPNQYRNFQGREEFGSNESAGYPPIHSQNFTKSRISDPYQQWTNLKSPPSAPKHLAVCGVMRPGIIRINADGQEAFAFTPPCIRCVQLRINCIASATSNVYPCHYCIKAKVSCCASVGPVPLAYRSQPLVTSAQQQLALTTASTRTPAPPRIPRYIPNAGPSTRTISPPIRIPETMALQNKPRKVWPGHISVEVNFPPNLPISISEILTFLPQHIQRPAIAARLLASGLRGIDIAVIINWTRDLIRNDEKLGGKTVTKAISTAMETVFGKHWRELSNEKDFIKSIEPYSRDLTTTLWSDHWPCQALATPIMTPRLTSLVEGVHPQRRPTTVGERLWLTRAIEYAELHGERDWYINDLFEIVKRLEMEGIKAYAPTASTQGNPDIEWVEGLRRMVGKQPTIFQAYYPIEIDDENEEA